MATVLGAFATSHATALIPPNEWDGVRALLRNLYEERLGTPPPPEPEQVAEERPDETSARYARLTAVHDLISKRLAEMEPDVLIIIGNDQDENFGPFAAPQFALCTGEDVLFRDRQSATSQSYRGDRAFALGLLGALLDSGFDVAQSWEPFEGALTAHAFTQIAHRFDPDARMAILPVFVNACTPPFAPPRRYFEFGRAIRSALSRVGEDKRVVLCASGGLSHFTLAQFTLAGYQGPHVMGSICSDFDEGLIGAIENGDFESIIAHTADEMVAQGDSEFFQGITLLGTLSDGARPQTLVYEPLYRAMTGLWAALWEPGL